MRSKDIDTTVEMIKSIYSLGVPLQSELSNPFDSNLKRKSKLVTKRNTNDIPENVNHWNSKDFVNYFALKYKEKFQGIYKKTYSSDCCKINEFIDFMEANELDKNEWTKKFLDWSFENSEFIQRKFSVFSLTVLRRFLNTFFQQVISVEQNSISAVDIYDEVTFAIETGKTKEVLATYGIPIISTYFINKKNIDKDKIKSGLNILFDKLMKGNEDETYLMNKIVQRSISKSPYPNNFELLDWREEFQEVSKKYKKELWWRDKDYFGNMQYKYDRFLKE